MPQLISSSVADIQMVDEQAKNPVLQFGLT